jgi:NAD(P)H-quinone oxidoreductase subunit 5
MIEIPTQAPAVTTCLLLAVPLCYVVAAIAAGARTRAAVPGAWARAHIAAVGALGLSVTLALALAHHGPVVFRSPGSVPLGPLTAALPGLRLDALTAVMLVLVSFIGLVILRFSRGYLAGDARQPYYVRWFMATLAAVTLLAISDNLLLIALAWFATSLSLHRLLVFYPERVWAQIAAHKKFLVSRVADAALLGAAGLIGAHFGTLELSELLPRAAAGGVWPASLHVAAALLVLAAALKCAQLPFHGWLLQVMEAPTPVSALLHAGIVNIGGFLMMRMAPFMAQSPLAQTLLVVCGTTTAVVAALVMTTRVSVKVMLAWSTCAQMGFMLLECGLGAYPLALLHLIGHSLYKAHAFLTAGSTVELWRTQAQTPAAPAAGPVAWCLSAALAVLAVAAAGVSFGTDPRREPALWALTLIVVLALSQRPSGFAGGWRAVMAEAGAKFGVALLYVGWHAVFARLVPAQAAAPSSEQLAVAMGGFVLLFVVATTIGTRPLGRFAQWLQPHLFAGLYLDETFTRITFRVWPPRLPATPRHPSATPGSPLAPVLQEELSS